MATDTHTEDAASTFLHLTVTRGWPPPEFLTWLEGVMMPFSHRLWAFGASTTLVNKETGPTWP